MTKTERSEAKRMIARLRTHATYAARNVCLNPANAATWRAEAAKFRALAAGLEIDVQIARHAATRA